MCDSRSARALRKKIFKMSCVRCAFYPIKGEWLTLFAPCVHQGDTPAPPPLAVPSPLSTSTELNSHDAEVNHAEICRQNSESDEDDFSIPPGVILVTTPMEELSHDEKTSNVHTSAIQGISKTRIAHLDSTSNNKTLS